MLSMYIIIIERCTTGALKALLKIFFIFLYIITGNIDTALVQHFDQWARMYLFDSTSIVIFLMQHDVKHIWDFERERERL